MVRRLRSLPFVRPAELRPSLGTGRETRQLFLDLGCLTGLSLVHEAVGKGVLPCRPGLVGEIEQDGSNRRRSFRDPKCGRTGQ